MASGGEGAYPEYDDVTILLAMVMSMAMMIHLVNRMRTVLLTLVRTMMIMIRLLTLFPHTHTVTSAQNAAVANDTVDDDGAADAQDDDDDAGHDVGDLFWTLGHAVLVLDAAAKHFTTRCEPCHVCVH